MDIIQVQIIGRPSYRVDTEEEAIADLVAAFSDDIEIGDWEFDGYCMIGKRYRRLVWEDAASAENDDGSHAVGTIMRFEEEAKWER